MSNNRDNFTKGTMELLAKRVGYFCSNPNCKKPTVGANEQVDKATTIGEAAHITAASKGGPRFDENLTQEQRRHYDNGIWLCSNCATLIDKDFGKFSIEVLKEWKSRAEDESRIRLSGGNAEIIVGPPILDVDLLWGTGIRINRGYSMKNPKRIHDGKEYIDVTGTPIIYWSISRQFRFVIHNNSSYPAFNLKIESVGEVNFNKLDSLPRVNNIVPLQNIAVKGEFEDFVEGVHTVADDILTAYIPDKLKDIELRITYYDEKRKQYINYIEFSDDGVSVIRV